MIYVVVLLTSVLCLMYLNKKMEIEMNVLQLHSYENNKMIEWLKAKEKEEDKKTKYKELLLLIGIVPLFMPNRMIGEFLSSLIVAIILFIFIKTTVNPNTKKPLVKTDRVKRMLYVYFGVILLALIIPKILMVLTAHSTVLINKLVYTFEILLFIALSKLSPRIIAFSNTALKPVEAKVNQRFYDEAADILKSMPDLKIIGITGSYGKTSTKYMVSGLLEEKFAVCKTPGSYNTLMGVIRTIREKLDRDDEIFVVEMGARHPNDIKEICDLVNPDSGIITAIGDAHLESFKTIEVTKETKFELARSLDKDKTLYINLDNKNLVDKLADDVEKKLNNYKVITYSLKDSDADFYATNVNYTGKGATFDVVVNKDKKVKFNVTTKLLGLCNVYNVLAAIAVADSYGLTKEEIIKGASKLKPVEHRLEILKSTSAITVIDDTFNANPEGTKEALEVLKRIEGNKKIIVTPGMIEMGEKEYDLNKEFGHGCIKNADYTIMVGKRQTKPMQDAFKEEKVSKDKYFVASNLDEASEHLRTILEVGDVVLYENDMPEDV